MSIELSVDLIEIVKELEMEILYINDKQPTKISNTEVNRPGLHLSGFFHYFDPNRIQILGKMEFAYLESLDEDLRKNNLESLFSRKVPAIVITRNQDIFPEMLEYAKKYNIPLLKTYRGTSNFMFSIINALSVALAPRITRHGVFVELYGEGVLLFGESGVGKSETAIELVKRGHRLIADDAVEIKKVNENTLIGTSPENIRHFLEIRGIGIINARRLFGMGSVNTSQKIDMLVELEPWKKDKAYDRMGLENEYVSVLDVKVPSLTIPVKPGRNLAVILEVAAINNRQKKMGYNAAQELMDNIGMNIDKKEDKVKNWDLF
ncbi:MAG: HPr(Ser) kinase/phosphatase [Oscillospiraceae bacterium]|nr:HPr(Ser) kinase/phosphatase [Oscillospiraceae bacterium]